MSISFSLQNWINIEESLSFKSCAQHLVTRTAFWSWSLILFREDPLPVLERAPRRRQMTQKRCMCWALQLICCSLELIHLPCAWAHWFVVRFHWFAVRLSSFLQAVSELIDLLCAWAHWFGVCLTSLIFHEIAFIDLLWACGLWCWTLLWACAHWCWTLFFEESVCEYVCTCVRVYAVTCVCVCVCMFWFCVAQALCIGAGCLHRSWVSAYVYRYVWYVKIVCNLQKHVPTWEISIVFGINHRRCFRIQLRLRLMKTKRRSPSAFYCMLSSKWLCLHKLAWFSMRRNT